MSTTAYTEDGGVGGDTTGYDYDGYDGYDDDNGDGEDYVPGGGGGKSRKR